MKRLFSASCLFFCLALMAGPAGAQPAVESSLVLEVGTVAVEGEWQVPLAELDAPLGLDANRDGGIEWIEIQHRRAGIEDQLDAHLTLLLDSQQAQVDFRQLTFGTRQGQPFILSSFAAVAPRMIRTIGVACDSGSEGGSWHGCQLRIRWRGVGNESAVLAPGSGVSSFSRASVPAPGILQSVLSGVGHIWIGYDHILFLLVLLIPAVLQRTAAGSEATGGFGSVLYRVLIVVTAFTLAHSLTLTLAAMQWVELPSRLVETAIAVSVLVAALHNFLPTTTAGRNAWLALGFGLLHGFGFASVLAETLHAQVPRWRTLLGFNLGVELGQLAIVAGFLPLAFVLRNTRFYRAGVLYGGSLAVCLASAVWIWRRAL